MVLLAHIFGNINKEFERKVFEHDTRLSFLTLHEFIIINCW